MNNPEVAAEARVKAREAALRAAAAAQRRVAVPRDYLWDKAQEQFWDTTNHSLHGALAVDGSIPQTLWRVVVNARSGAEHLVRPSQDIMRIESNQTVEGATWWPGRPAIINDVFIGRDGPVPSPGCRILNQYRPPPPMPSSSDGAEPWLDHVRALWPEECEYFFNYCAHMVQRPAEKAHAAIVLSGAQGVGKDATLYPIRAALGAWNVKNINPDELLSPYRPWLQTLMLVVDEVRPNKDEFHASSLYNILKSMITTPPNTLPLNDKYMALRYVVNVLRVFITTNDWMAMYIPSEDRRMFIMHSTKPQGWQPQSYFDQLFGWFEAGGDAAVARWLTERDIAHFSPKAQPPRTAGWEAVANTWSEPEDAFDAALTAMGRPDVFFGLELAETHAFDGAEDIAGLLKSPRKCGFRLQRAGYVALACPGADRWSFAGPARRVQARLAFARQTLDRATAVKMLRERGRALACGENIATPANE